jgi:hypothetical protein
MREIFDTGFPPETAASATPHALWAAKLAAISRIKNPTTRGVNAAPAAGKNQID